MLTIILIYLGLGVVVGILAGLLGVGGGLVIVPMVVFTLTWQGVPSQHLMHLALGTSLASIIFTSVSSFWAHHKRGAVNWTVVRRIVLGILTGTFLGSCLAARMSTNLLKGVFVVFLFYMGFQMLTNKKPKPTRGLPGPLGMFGVGNGIGAVSALVGIGGGSLSVPFMVWCNVTVHEAIGTSAAIGFPIAVAGTVGYIVNGLGVAGLPRLLSGVCVSAGPGRHRRRQCIHRAPGRPSGPQPAGRQAQADLRPPALRYGDKNAHRPVLSPPGGAAQGDSMTGSRAAWRSCRRRLSAASAVSYREKLAQGHGSLIL